MIAPARKAAGPTDLARYHAAPLIEAALPAHHLPPLRALDIHRAVNLGALNTTRTVLRILARDGRAIASSAPYAGTEMRLYRRPAPIQQEEIDACLSW